MKKPTFAEMVKDVAEVPAKVVPLRPGRVNRAGVLASPDGAAFTREREAIDPATARELVGAGALVAMEACGCGGDYCEPEWVALAALPGLVASEPVRTRDLDGADLRLGGLPGCRTSWLVDVERMATAELRPRLQNRRAGRAVSGGDQDERRVPRPCRLLVGRDR